MRSVNPINNDAVWRLRYDALNAIGTEVSSAWAGIYDDTDYDSDALELDDKASEAKDIKVMSAGISKILSILQDEENQEKACSSSWPSDDFTVNLHADHKTKVSPEWIIRYNALNNIDLLFERAMADLDSSNDDSEMDDDEATLHDLDVMGKALNAIYVIVKNVKENSNE